MVPFTMHLLSLAASRLDCAQGGDGLAPPSFSAKWNRCLLMEASCLTQMLAQNEEGPQRTHSLDSGQSQTLKVSPTRKVLSLISYGKGGASEKVGNVINLHFEGNWMPLKVCSKCICKLVSAGSALLPLQGRRLTLVPKTF